MRNTVGNFGVVLLAAPIVLAGCHGESSKSTIQVRNPGIVTRDTTRALGPGDVRIVSTDSTIEIALIGDTIITGLAAKALAKVQAETDTGPAPATGLAGRFENLIKSSVRSALNKQLAFPVSEVADVTYTAGTLQFVDVKGKRMATFGGTDTTARAGKFSPADARAFIAAFKARKSRPA